MAYDAAKKVNVTYDNVQTPVVEIKDSITLSEKAGKAEELVLKVCKSPVEGSLSAVTKTIQGEFRTRGQYHFHMETQICICVPTEDGMDVHTASQFIDQAQAAVAQALAMPNNRLE